MDNIVEGLQIAFDKLKAGIETFGDDLQKVRNRSSVNQGAVCHIVMLSNGSYVLWVGIQRAHADGIPSSSGLPISKHKYIVRHPYMPLCEYI